MENKNDDFDVAVVSAKFDNFINWIKNNFKGERQEKLIKLHNYMGTRMLVAPASGKEYYHYAYPGGYMDHVMNVCRASIGVKKLCSAMKMRIDFTDEELLFSCLCHDLGKLGDENGEYYIPETSEWHTKNQGSIFQINGEIQFMHVTDRALYLLQSFEIKVSQKEYLAIKLSDGLFCEPNKSYIHTYQKDQKLKTNLPHVVHMADFICYNAEHDEWKYKQK